MDRGYNSLEVFTILMLLKARYLPAYPWLCLLLRLLHCMYECCMSRSSSTV